MLKISPSISAKRNGQRSNRRQPEHRLAKGGKHQSAPMLLGASAPISLYQRARSASAMSADSFFPRPRATRSATSMVALRSTRSIRLFKASSGQLFCRRRSSRVDAKVVRNPESRQFRAGKIQTDPLFSLLASFFRGFPAAKCRELAIRCALNGVDESMDIQRLGPNLDRSPCERIGGFRCRPYFSAALARCQMSQRKESWTHEEEI